MMELGQTAAAILLIVALFALLQPEALGRAARSIVDGFQQGAD